ncbi:ABC transporter substrate-binding protein [Streptomyces sp. NPDC004749]
MSHVGAPRGRTCSRTLRSVALVTTGVLALPGLSACSSDQDGGDASAAPDIAPAARDVVSQGGTLRWAVDSVPATLNVFQADASSATSRIAGAVLPSLFTLDKRGRPQHNKDYLESAKVVEREPKQVVLYKLNQQAVWSDGREIGAADFAAQWRALRGKDSAYWTARNAGYERIEKIERGASNLEVRVTYAKPYADWKSLFSPLYPKDITGKPNSFNDKARSELKTTAGPFKVKSVDRKDKKVTLVRNPRWWGDPAKLDAIVLSAVPRNKRASALADGKIDLAELDTKGAERVSLALADTGTEGQALNHGPGAEITPASALRSWALAHGSDDEKAEEARIAREQTAAAIKRYAREQKALRRYELRKSLEPAYTQLAMNGESGPLADERVRRAIARAIDRQELADLVLKPLGLPARPLGSHLALLGQEAYADSSDALGEQDTKEALALLADAGWTPGGALRKAGVKAGSEGKKKKAADADKEDGGDEGNEDGGNSDEKRSGTEGSAPGEQPARPGPVEERPSERRAPARGTAEEERAGEGRRERAEADGREKEARRPAERADKAQARQQRPAEPEPERKTGTGKKPVEQSAADEAATDEGTYIVGQDGKPGEARRDGKPAVAHQDDKPPAVAHQDDRPGRALPYSPFAPEFSPGRATDTHFQEAPFQEAPFQGRSMLRRGAFFEDSGSRQQPARAAQEPQDKKQNGVTGAYAPRGTAAPAPVGGPLGKNGKRLTLRFVLPKGEGSESLRAVGERIARMLDRIGIGTEITKVDDASYFKDHIASGVYDLALYSWPATAYPATDGRPIFAKPVPASDGSLLVEQNYTRVGTNHIDQLFDQAVAELDEKAARDLVRRADARIWAAAGSIPLYQRPELVAAKPGLVNAGAFGLSTPRYQDIGFQKAGSAGPDGKKK